MGKVHPRMGRRGPSRVRPGQVADAMRVRAGVAPRVASGDRAASKGKPAGGCSSLARSLKPVPPYICAMDATLTIFGVVSVRIIHLHPATVMVTPQ